MFKALLFAFQQLNNCAQFALFDKTEKKKPENRKENPSKFKWRNIQHVKIGSAFKIQGLSLFSVKRINNLLLVLLYGCKSFIKGTRALVSCCFADKNPAAAFMLNYRACNDYNENM